MNDYILGSICSGIGGAELAFAGLATATWASEIADFPRAVLMHRFPHVRLHGDFVPLIDDAPMADIIGAGCPCTSFSIAGKRLSLDDARGNLTLAATMLFDAVDSANTRGGRRPCVILYENVPGILSTKDNAFGCFLGALVGASTSLVPGRGRSKWANAGMVAGPKRVAAWRVVDAQFFGLAQRRKRVFVVASAREGFDPSAVLLEREGIGGYSPTRRKTREEVAGTIGSRTSGGGGLDRVDPAGELQSVVSVALRGRDGGGTAELGGDLAPALRASSGGGDKPHVLAPVVYDTTQVTSVANRSRPQVGDPCHPLVAGGHPPLMVPYRVTGNCGAYATGDHVDALTTGTDFDLAGGLQPVIRSEVIAIQERAICENPSAGPDGVGVRADGLAYTLEARGVPQAVFDPSSHVLAFGGNNLSGPIDVATAVNACPSASSGGGDKPHVLAPVVYDTTQVTSVANRSRPQVGDTRGQDPVVAMAYNNTGHGWWNEDVVAATVRKGDDNGGGGARESTLVAVGDVLAFSCKDHGADAGDLAPTLRAMGHSESHANAGGQVAIAFGGNNLSGPIDVATAVNACPSASGRMDFESFCVTGTIAHALKAEGADASEDGTGRGNPIVNCGYGVRRLTPLECELLQGLPPGHTLIPTAAARGVEADYLAYLRQHRPELSEDDAQRLAKDGPRYKAIGNGWAINCVRWIAERLIAEMRRVDV